MIDLEQMYRCEAEFPLRFTNVCDKPYGRLFYNEDNPLSNDSNHAIILNLDADMDGAVDDIVGFYQGKGLTPRVYPGYLKGEVDVLRPFLERHGFTFELYENEYFEWRNPPAITPNPDVEVRRIREIDASVFDLLCACHNSDRTVRILRRHLLFDDLYFLVGYVGSRAVTAGSFEVCETYARVDNVDTHPDCQNRGYCRALMHAMLGQYPSVSKKPLYLWAGNPVAIRIYREAGFVDFPSDRPAWGAWRDG